MQKTPKVVCVASLKGGAGKSTTVIHLATAALEDKVVAHIFDLDSDQQACAKWHDTRLERGFGDAPSVSSVVHTRLPQAIKGLSNVDLVFLDTPAAKTEVLNEAIRVSDFILVICRPTVQDLQFLSTTIKTISTVESMSGQHYPYWIVLNQVEPQIPETEQSRTFISNNKFSLWSGALSKSVIYSRALVTGQGVTEFKSKGKASSQIRNLWSDLSGKVKIRKGTHQRIGLFNPVG